MPGLGFTIIDPRVRRRLGKEGGKVTGRIMKERSVEVYIKLVNEIGLIEALARCKDDTYKLAYAKGYATAKRTLVRMAINGIDISKVRVR